MESIDIDKAIEALKEKIPYISERKKKDWIWLINNRDKLVKFEGNWIAIYNEQVIAFGKEVSVVFDEAKARSGNEVDIYLRFLEDSGSIL